MRDTYTLNGGLWTIRTGWYTGISWIAEDRKTTDMLHSVARLRTDNKVDVGWWLEGTVVPVRVGIYSR